MKVISSIIRSFLFAILNSILILNLAVGPAFPQAASLLPNALQVFLDNDGNPVSSGTVDFYVPGTSTRKTTWKDAAKTIANTNPVVLDAAGRAQVYGFGDYRQVVKDKDNNLVWDKTTNSYAIPNAGSSTGDGLLVGSILTWSGLTPPSQYVFAFGQELSRTNFQLLFTTLTLSQPVNCTNGSPTLSGVSDTSQVPIGAKIEVACISGTATVTAKTISTYTVSSNALVTTTVTAVVFPYGNGDGSLTFNVPDLRGRTLAGRDNMGDIAANRLTSTYFLNSVGTGITAGAIGAGGGAQNNQILATNLPELSVAITDPGHVHTQNGQTLYGSGSTNPVGVNPSGSFGGQPNSTTMAAFTGITAKANAGGANNPISVIQPTITVNYVIKTTPDTSFLIATGVQSFGGMTGAIACGTGLTCNGQNVSVTTGGTDTQIQFNSGGLFAGSQALTWVSPKLTVGLNGFATGQFAIAGLTSGGVTQTAQAVAGTPTVTWGTSSGTPIVTASSPFLINTTTGNLSATVTGTGAIVLASTPSIANPTITGHPTIESVTSTGATGTGKFVFDNSPSLISPNVGIATGTSIALGGATLGTNALAVTGSANVSGQITSGAAINGNVLNTALGQIYSNGVIQVTFGSFYYGSRSGGGAFFNSSTGKFAFASGADAGGTIDTQITRPSAGVVSFDTGTVGNSLGSLLAANYNKLIITPPATSATLTIANGKTATFNNSISLSGTDGKTLSVSNSITFAGTDGTTLTGPTTNATLAALNIASQTITGGANVTTLAQSTGNITVDCGQRPTQSIMNGGAFTITAPANDGYCVLKVTNNASAGTITFTGFNVGSNTGDALTNTNTSAFLIFVYRIGGTSTYSIKAMQ